MKTEQKTITSETNLNYIHNLYKLRYERYVEHGGENHAWGEAIKALGELRERLNDPSKRVIFESHQEIIEFDEMNMNTIFIFRDIDSKEIIGVPFNLNSKELKTVYTSARDKKMLQGLASGAEIVSNIEYAYYKTQIKDNNTEAILETLREILGKDLYNWDLVTDKISVDIEVLDDSSVNSIIKYTYKDKQNFNAVIGSINIKFDGDIEEYKKRVFN